MTVEYESVAHQWHHCELTLDPPSPLQSHSECIIRQCDYSMKAGGTAITINFEACSSSTESTSYHRINKLAKRKNIGSYIMHKKEVKIQFKDCPLCMLHNSLSRIASNSFTKSASLLYVTCTDNSSIKLQV